MPRLVFSWWVVFGGVLLGALIPQDEPIIRLVAGVTTGLIALLIYLVYTSVRHDFLLKNRGFLKSEQPFIDLILQLAAAAAMADGSIAESERIRLKTQLDRAYPTKKSERYFAVFERYLDQTIPVEKICQSIHEDFDDNTKGHLLYLLFSIVTADGLLTVEESRFIETIVRYARIKMSVANSVYRLFSYEQEQTYQKQNERNYSQAANSKSKLSAAYTLLGLSENCTDKDVKRGFRQLAKIHHPDKLGHLDENKLEIAQEKFRHIIAAYERIKKARGL